MSQLGRDATAQTPDTSTVFRRAARAQMAYEAGVRTFAPVYSSPIPENRCDEWVGRYCLIYDAGSEKLPPEPIRLRVARDSAIAAVGRAFALAPSRAVFAHGLVRDLVRAGRTSEAVEVARVYARATSNGPDSDMLAGYALHFDRQTSAALQAFARWTARLSAERRNRLVRPDWLLDSRARKNRTLLPAAERERQDSLLWRYADPLYLTPGNDLLADHFARHAEATMIAQGPRIFNADAWGEDSEQLMIRFGEPVLTTRPTTPSSLGGSTGFSEHWNTDERTYFPPDLSAAMRLRPRLDTIWAIDSLTAHSGHAPPTIRRMRVLQYQSGAFPGSQTTYRLMGKAIADSALHPEGLVGALFLLDSALVILQQTAATISVAADTVVFRAEAVLPERARFFSAEIFDTISRYAARARFSVEQPRTANGLALSSLLLSSADQPEQPLLWPIVASGSRFGIYATLIGSGTVRLQLETHALSGLGVPVRIARWLGRRVGLGAGGRAPAIGWTVELTTDKASIIAVAVDAGKLKPGHYLVRLSATPQTGGKTIVAEREFLVTDLRAASSGRP